MWRSLVALLAIGNLVSAASPAKATYCSEDNLLRAFQHTPTPASKYCTTATGYPTFLAVTTYPPTRLSSACSCLSRFPTEGVAAPTCTPNTVYRFQGTGNGKSIPANILITINRSTPCGEAGFAITNICGTLDGNAITFNPAETYGQSPDNCYYPDTPMPIDINGVDFSAGGETFNFHWVKFIFYIFGESVGLYEYYFAIAFTDVACGALDSTC